MQQTFPAREKGSNLWPLAALLGLALLLLVFRPVLASFPPDGWNTPLPEAKAAGTSAHMAAPQPLPAPLPPQTQPVQSSQISATPVPAAAEPQPIPLPIPTPPDSK